MCGTRNEDVSANIYKIGYREVTARIQACGEYSDGGMVEIPVYESSFNEAKLTKIVKTNTLLFLNTIFF